MRRKVFSIQYSVFRPSPPESVSPPKSRWPHWFRRSLPVNPPVGRIVPRCVHASDEPQNLYTEHCTLNTLGCEPAHNQAGSTLLIVLGILSVMAVLAITFFTVSRIHSRTTTTRIHRSEVRQHLNEALYTAVKAIEDSCNTDNFDRYTGATEGSETPPADPQRPSGLRLAPVGAWFSDDWQMRNNVNSDFRFQTTGILTSPVATNQVGAPAQSVNLFTPELMALLPPLITNELHDIESDSIPLRSGWQLAELPRWRNEGEPEPLTQKARFAYAIFDLSGTIDVNYFVSGPTTDKIARVCFNQSDIAEWLINPSEGADQKLDALDTLNLDYDDLPLATISYDPDPDSDPLAPDSATSHPLLGYRSFGQLKKNRKFNLNNLTNLLQKSENEGGSTRNLENNAELMSEWLRPVANALQRANFQQEGEHHEERLNPLRIASTSWNLLNFMDEDRVPQLSPFAGLELATRHNAAIEDVPLINKISVFNIFGGGNSPQDPPPPAGYGPSYYGVDPNLSNHYAVAIELWYPFAPNPPPPSSAFYAGVYTNETDVGETTSERPFTVEELHDWFLWNEAASDNTVMQTLFVNWANSYISAVGTNIWSHPLWQTITEDSDYWFTTNMVNHSSWPQPDESGYITITNTPIWDAFYPDTYEVYTTNQVEVVVSTNDDVVVTEMVDVVTTNHFTYLNITNTYIYLVPDPDIIATNKYIEFFYDNELSPYPIVSWQDLESETITTNLFGGFTDTDDELTTFYNPPDDPTEHLLEIYPVPATNQIMVVYSNELSSVVTTNYLVNFALAPMDGDDPPLFNLYTNVYVYTEIIPIPPLPMPDDLGGTLAGLFAILQSPELSLDTSDKLYDYLMLMPSEFDDLWQFMDGHLAEYPLIQKSLVPTYREPDLGYLSDRDRIELTEPGNWDEIGEVKTSLTDYFGNSVGELIEGQSDGFGTYWIVYPRQTVSFQEITIIEPEEGVGGTGGADTPQIVITNFCALGSVPGQAGEQVGGSASSGDRYRLFLRPVVTLIPRAEDQIVPETSEGGEQLRSNPDVVVDEALLDGNAVRGWLAVTNIYVADPRHNAFANYWLPNERYPAGSTLKAGRPPVIDFDTWENFIGTTNLSTEVTEYPFIHLNRPLESIGEIGHLYTSPDRLNLTSGTANIDLTSEDLEEQPEGQQHIWDTISFATRSGAALLDMLTINPSPQIPADASSDETSAADAELEEGATTNNEYLPPAPSWRGLVQANTPYPGAVAHLFSDIWIGWTNSAGFGNNLENYYPLNESSELMQIITESYLNSQLVDLDEHYGNHNDTTPLTRGAMGWRSYADMLPAIATNRILTEAFQPPNPNAPAHDWVEDALRHLPDRTSFRQNIYMVVVAVQTLSPASTPSRPRVTAEQRAAITIIRDAYTGRWLIHSWRWLSE